MTRYRLQDAVHFSKMYARSWRRQRIWADRYERAIARGSYKLPSPAVVQIIPTEACNLRCNMCNQWGENGYFKTGARPVDHMDPKALATLLRSVSPRDSLISVHGGEPFAYKHAAEMLGLLTERPYDVMFSTNGTLLAKHLDALCEIDNLSFLLSIDGDEETHDSIRGKGRFGQAKEAMAELYRLRRKRGKPLPMVVMSFVVCELTGDAIEGVFEAARSFGALVLNYNMRWFLPEEAGLAYEKQISARFGVASSGAWRGWLSDSASHDYGPTCDALTARLRKSRFSARPPFVMTTPDHLRKGQFRAYFADYMNTFGNESCFMPYYWARIHANGELIFCPGHPDLIAGNVFRDGLEAAFNSERAVEFRKHMLTHRMPICNRCCGLYMTNTARKHEQSRRRSLGIAKTVDARW